MAISLLVERVMPGRRHQTTDAGASSMYRDLASRTGSKQLCQGRRAIFRSEMA